jgi:cytochrome c oxidase assembly protein subunit 11
MLNPKEEIFLPIYFYLEPEINDDVLLKSTNEIKIIYK